MALKPKRFLKKNFASTKAVIPTELEFLSGVNFLAVEKRRVQKVQGWYVEIRLLQLKGLLSAKKKLNEARALVRTVLIRLSQTSTTYSRLAAN